MTIEIVKGDLLDAFDNYDVNIIAHCCNMQNTMGSGIARSIRDTYPQVYAADTEWYNQTEDERDYKHLSVVSWVDFPGPKSVFNIYGQEFFGTKERPLNYGRLSMGLLEMLSLIQWLNENKDDGLEIKIGFPYKMASDRAGGDWEIVLELITYYFQDYDVKIYKL